MLVPTPHTNRGQWPARVIPVLPLVTVTSFAGLGQVLAGVGAYTPSNWDTPVRVLVAIGIAIGLEMIAVYVQWHAHDALLLKATATAARLRRVSYLVAGAVATFQYSHFADHWAPTASAVVFAAFSGSSPWLWGLHTRRAQHLQLLREGHADAGGATFSAERWRAFPLRTWNARRWSIDHSVTNPREAWEGYRTAADERAGPDLDLDGSLDLDQAAEFQTVSDETSNDVEPSPVAARGRRQGEPTDVYRAFDASGRLLYVGVTARLNQRIHEHRSTKDWWSEVAEIQSETYPGRATALAVEHSAVANERPIYNIARGGLRDHSGGEADPSAFVMRSRKLLRADGERIDTAADAVDSLSPEVGSVEEVMQAEGVPRSAAQRRVHLVRTAVEGRASRKTVTGGAPSRRALDTLTEKDRSRIADLVAQGYGRPRLAEEFQISSHEARKIIDELRGKQATG